MSNGRGGRKYMAAIAELKSRGEVQPCWRCGKLLYAAAPRNHQLSITLGHIVALEDGGELLDPANYAAECMKCNYGDGARRTNAKRRGERQTQRHVNPRWLATYDYYTKPMVFDEQLIRASRTGCPICGSAAQRTYCSKAHAAEAVARRARDRYRKRVGLPTDPTRPTRPSKRGSTDFLETRYVEDRGVSTILRDDPPTPSHARGAFA